MAPSWPSTSRPPPRAGVGGNRAAKMIAGLSGITISAQIHDQAALARAIEPMMTVANQVLQGAPAGNRGIQFRKQEGARRSYILDLSPNMLPPPFSTLFRPTIVVGKDQLIVGASTDPAERAANLSGTPRDRPGSRRVPSSRLCDGSPPNLVYLRIADPRETMPAIIESLPKLAQHSATPRSQQMRGAAPGRPELPGLPSCESTLTNSRWPTR